MQPARLDTATIARRTLAMQKALARARLRGAATLAIGRDGDGGEIHSVLPARVSMDALHRMPQGAAWVVRVYQPAAPGMPAGSALLVQRQQAIEAKLRHLQQLAVRLARLMDLLDGRGHQPPPLAGAGPGAG